MDEPKANDLRGLMDRGTKYLFIGVIFISTLIYLLHIVTHFPFFDGTIHARYLWLIAHGYRANVDFFCIYPTLGYFLTLPYFSLFPESSYVLLALRLFSAVLIACLAIVYYQHGRRLSNYWIIALLPFILIGTDRSVGVFFSEYSIDHFAALTAIWALTIIMSAPRFGKLVLCTALAVASLFFMPKYHYPLFFGLLGYLWTFYAREKRPLLLVGGLLAGAAAALVAIGAVFLLNHGSLVNNFKYAYLFNFKLANVMDERLPDSPLFAPMINHAQIFLRHHPFLLTVYALGIAGWGRYVVKTWPRPDHYVWGGGGILLGCLLSTSVTTIYTEQYLTPLLLCLALFVPFIFSEVISSRNSIRYLRAVLVVIVFCMLVVRLDHVADEFQLTPSNSRGNTVIERTLLGEVIMAPTGINILNEYDRLLDIIPENETVVAAWPYQPIFRRDLTYQIYDDLPSLSMGLSQNTSLRKTFAPNTFRKALEKSPPALIILQGMDEYFPLGWDKVAADFIARSRDLYVTYTTLFLKAYIRKDLLDR